jgi:hypothetical protein
MDALSTTLPLLEKPLNGNVRHSACGSFLGAHNPKVGRKGKHVVPGLLYDPDSGGFNPLTWPFVCRPKLAASVDEGLQDDRASRFKVRRPRGSGALCADDCVLSTASPLQVASSLPGHKATLVFVLYPSAKKSKAEKHLLKVASRTCHLITACNPALRTNDGHAGQMSGSGKHVTMEGCVSTTQHACMTPFSLTITIASVLRCLANFVGTPRESKRKRGEEAQQHAMILQARLLLEPLRGEHYILNPAVPPYQRILQTHQHSSQHTCTP